VAGAVPTDQPSALGTPRQLVISAADFYPASNDVDYYNDGNCVVGHADFTGHVFMAPIDFPAPNWVTIDKFELFAYDNNPLAGIYAAVYLSKPSSGTEQPIAQIETGYDFADPTNPRTWETTAISPNVKNPANDLHVLVNITDNDSLRLCGARIWYRVGK
jgi:hypothetical protein